ncbi:uncharacterized protein LOC119725929 [Patiria miniata]|uniref:Uncharacterized protein n=1 Tax=Patiria miniata TaxID=46514 RepID=A0A913ZQQ8_PATMI|nr:uncharacterized protein LOC119725929 [Patiria miniata]XP_038053471.1 uncharacterized protein LOC119725929 [Patiria miniata]
MKILCLVLVVALLQYSAAVPSTCQTCVDGVACSKLDWATKENCATPNNVGCYRQLRNDILLKAGCANAAMKKAAGDKNGECDTSNDIRTCFCDDKDDCNSASFIKLSVLALAAALAAALWL